MFWTVDRARQSFRQSFRMTSIRRSSSRRRQQRDQQQQQQPSSPTRSSSGRGSPTSSHANDPEARPGSSMSTALESPREEEESSPFPYVLPVSFINFSLSWASSCVCVCIVFHADMRQTCPKRPRSQNPQSSFLAFLIDSQNENH